MKTSKQIENELVMCSFTAPAELYFKMKFEAEKLGYKDMAKYYRDHFKTHFVENGFAPEKEAE